MVTLSGLSPSVLWTDANHCTRKENSSPGCICTKDLSEQNLCLKYILMLLCYEANFMDYVSCYTYIIILFPERQSSNLGSYTTKARTEICNEIFLSNPCFPSGLQHLVKVPCDLQKTLTITTEENINKVKVPCQVHSKHILREHTSTPFYL